MALIEKAKQEHNQRQKQDPDAPASTWNPEITSIAPRNKHAAPPKVKLYQPAINIPPPSGSKTGPISTTASGGVPPSDPRPPKVPPASAATPSPSSTGAGASGAYKPFKPATKIVPGHAPFPASNTAGLSTLEPFANSMPPHLAVAGPSALPFAQGGDPGVEGDVLDEPEPSAFGGPTISSEDRDKQLQDMVAHMVNVIDVDISKAKVDGMKCMLLPHQIQGVQWMKEREMGKYKGGILADSMGLGKTVQMLALVVSNRPGQEGASIDNVAPDTPVKKRGPKPKYAPPTKAASGTAATAAAAAARAQVKGKGTLIIAPLAVVKQWEREVLEKTDAGLTVYVHHGPKRAKSAAELARYDVVVTTYPTASSEFASFIAGRDAAAKKQLDSSDSEELDESSDGASDSDSDDAYGRGTGSRRKRVPAKGKKVAPPAKKDKACPLFETDWLRVVLDEAQNIKNHTAKCSKACFSLSSRAHSRWCLTGTPIQNDSYELFSLIHFLRIAPFDDYKHFKKLIGDPLKSSNQNRVNWGMKRLCIVLQTIMLRRTKDATYEGKPILQLPDREVEVVSCDFDDPEERAFYAELESTIRKNKSEAEAREEKNSTLADLVMLLRLRQACSHPTLTMSKTADKDAITAPVASTMGASPGGDAAADGEDDGDELAAMFSSLAVAKKLCERCQAPLRPTSKSLCDSCGEAAQKMKGANWTAEKGSTKIRMMLKILDEIRQGDKAEKTIIFSQFTSFLDLVEPFLVTHRYNFVRYDGQMRPEERERSLERIRSDPAVTVILISFKAGATGLNLTCCSRVVLMDLWWNPQIEEQAFDRAHRLGQQRDVKIYKLSITKTVEERILDLQDKKRSLAKAALEGSKMTKANRLDKTELMYLFNGGPREGRKGG
ncbi:related to ULS1 |nr:related to ULS1 \